MDRRLSAIDLAYHGVVAAHCPTTRARTMVLDALEMAFHLVRAQGVDACRMLLFDYVRSMAWRTRGRLKVVTRIPLSSLMKIESGSPPTLTIPSHDPVSQRSRTTFPVR